MFTGKSRKKDFYPRPPRGGRLYRFPGGDSLVDISIHALREEGDTAIIPRSAPSHPISIHALREEGDLACMKHIVEVAEFLSTPSARRATERPQAGHPRLHISIHALREEGDSSDYHKPAVKVDFYPRPPRGGRRLETLSRLAADYFYPRPPRGGRQRRTLRVSKSYQFLSTPSARRATGERFHPGEPLRISIHALREEGDARSRCRGSRREDFYPRPPRGGRRRVIDKLVRDHLFLSTPSARRATIAGRWL